MNCPTCNHPLPENGGACPYCEGQSRHLKNERAGLKWYLIHLAEAVAVLYLLVWGYHRIEQAQNRSTPQPVLRVAS